MTYIMITWRYEKLYFIVSLFNILPHREILHKLKGKLIIYNLFIFKHWPISRISRILRFIIDYLLLPSIASPHNSNIFKNLYFIPLYHHSYV